MGTSLRSCVKVRKAIEPLFGVVSGVGLGIGVVHIPKGKGRFWGFFWSIALNGVFEFIRKRNVSNSCMKSLIFLFGQYINRIVI